MSFEPAIFGVFALLTVGSALLVALARNIIHASMALLGTLGGVAGLYGLLAADFLAAAQVLVYVGGTLTLILFAVMLTARIEQVSDSNPSLARGLVGTVVLVLVGVLVRIVLGTSWGSGPSGVRGSLPREAPAVPSTARLGHAFLGEYVLPFELASVVLLAALVGAVVLARRAVHRAGEDVGPS